MAVKPVKGKGRKKPVPKALKAIAKPDSGLSHIVLPENMKQPDPNFLHYLTLFYGVPKVGKTTAAASFPGAIFFCTEPGARGLEIFEFNHENGGVTDWDILRHGVDLLVKNKGKFQTVIIDTVDVAYNHCLDWVCATKGIEYPGRDAEGDEDFGKSWRAVRQEFTEQIYRLVTAGYGLVQISHAKSEPEKSYSGKKFSKILPSMGKQAREITLALVDFIFYAEFMTTADDKNARVLICEGDEMITAGARTGLTDSFPKYLPLTKENSFDIIQQAFRGEYRGLDPASLKANLSTSKTASTLIDKDKAKGVRQKVIGKKPIKKKPKRLE